MSLKAIKCKECGANIKYDNSKDTVTCEYCGATYVVDSNESNNIGKKEKSNFNLFKRGLEFLEIGETDNADECFNKILENDIDNCLAYAGKAVINNIRYEVDTIKVQKHCLSKALETYNKVLPEEKEIIVKLLNFTNDDRYTLLHLAVSGAMYDEVKFLLENGIEVNQISTRFGTPLCLASLTSLDKPNALKTVRLLLEYGADESSLLNKKYIKNIYLISKEVLNIIKELRPNADLSSIDWTDPNRKGCYIATAVYGSYDCPSVWTLRRYRDHILKSTWYGRAFIKVYYAISPTFVKIFGQTLWFNKFFKSKLDRLVVKLQDSGMASSAYEDLNK